MKLFFNLLSEEGLTVVATCILIQRFTYGLKKNSGGSIVFNLTICAAGELRMFRAAFNCECILRRGSFLLWKRGCCQSKIHAYV
jgi:hypothetical protein